MWYKMTVMMLEMRHMLLLLLLLTVTVEHRVSWGQDAWGVYTARWRRSGDGDGVRTRPGTAPSVVRRLPADRRRRGARPLAIYTCAANLIRFAISSPPWLRHMSRDVATTTTPSVNAIRPVDVVLTARITALRNTTSRNIYRRLENGSRLEKVAE